jgi:hypothetical protein
VAHLHYRRTVYKSGGTAATNRIDYITRKTVEKLSAAERNLAYISKGREDLVYAHTRNLPSWAGSAREFFTAAEKYERVRGVAFEEWKITLPHEFTHGQNMQLMQDLVEAIAGDRLPITYAFHNPQTLDEQRQQPHLHLMISARQNDGIVRTAAQHFKRYNHADPGRGGAQKDPAMNHMGAVKAHRVLIADIVNAHLERHGHAARIHPDRLEDRDIERQPEPKLLPSESREYREKGIVSARMQEVLSIRAERSQQWAREQNDAYRYWESRKAELGLTRDMSMQAKLAHIREARRHTMTHAPERSTLAQLREQEQALAQRITGLERHLQDLQQYARREQRIDQRRERREWQGELAAERVLATGQAHGLPRDRQAEQRVARLERTARTSDVAQRLRGLVQALTQDEPQHGAALRIKLFDREEERERAQDRGMDW